MDTEWEYHSEMDMADPSLGVRLGGGLTWHAQVRPLPDDRGPQCAAFEWVMHSSWMTCGCMAMHGWLKWSAFGSGHYAFDAVYVQVDLGLLPG